MSDRRTKKSGNNLWLLIATLVVVAAFIQTLWVKRLFELTVSPAKKKDCDFIFPPAADRTKPTAISVPFPEHLLTFEQKGGVINDASCLNRTPIYGIVRISTIDDVREALRFARENGLKVASAGARHSMGGQSFVKNGLVLDMKNFNNVSLDRERKILRAQAGATWGQIQKFLDAQGFAVKAMQSINIFTVGGTLSVNAHGIAHDPGQVAPTVRSIRVMLADGDVRTAGPTENPELFRHVLGGYGLFGVIIDAELDVVENELYDLKTDYISYRDFPDYYRERVQDDDRLGLFYGRLSVSPTSYLTEMAAHRYVRLADAAPPPPLQPEHFVWLHRFVINNSKSGGGGRWLRWMLEKYLEPRVHICVSRNEAMSRNDEDCWVTRNQEMFDSMDYLKNRLKDTDILQEYFVPFDKMPEFVDGLRNAVKNNGANLLNVTVRVVHRDDVTALPYARKDMAALVLYFNQTFSRSSSETLRKTTGELVDLAAGLGGTFYLPYRLYYTPEQLRKAYPSIDAFFAAKQNYDPAALFSNTFYETFAL